MQTTDTILMVRPAAFRSNPGTLESNPFQDSSEVDLIRLNLEACAEFDALAAALRDAGVRVLSFQDDAEPATPDSIFPNNWFSTHADGRLLLYPMEELSRRAERRLDLLTPALAREGFLPKSVDQDLVQRFESQQLFLEGTGSMVLDRVNRVAYASRSSRTSDEAMAAFCQAHGYQAQLFDAFDESGQAYYHTNVIMGLGLDFAVLCLEAIPGDQQAAVVRSVESGGRRLITITQDQACHFAGNLLELKTLRKERLVVMSASAHAAFGELQCAQLALGGARLLAVPIPSIERFGGGSVRCMLAEIFLPRDLAPACD